MNEFGGFLFSLLKEKGMTQSELATTLGVTNKAVSKWETGDSMPETSLLIPIANVFGVTVDELLKGKRADGSLNGEKAETPENKERKTVNVCDYAFKRDGDDEPSETESRDAETGVKFVWRWKQAEKIKSAVCTFLFFGSLVTYLILGATLNLWHPYWVLIPVGALGCGVVGIIVDACCKATRAQKRKNGENPVAGAISGTVVLLSIMTYLLLGAIGNMWHPYWIIIIIGIAICAITCVIGKAAGCSKDK